MDYPKKHIETLASNGALLFLGAEDIDDGVDHEVAHIEGTSPDTDLYAAYDPDAAAHAALEGYGIGPGHPDYQWLREKISARIAKLIENSAEITHRRAELAHARYNFAGYMAIRLAKESPVDPKE